MESMKKSYLVTHQTTLSAFLKTTGPKQVEDQKQAIR